MAAGAAVAAVALAAVAALAAALGAAGEEAEAVPLRLPLEALPRRYRIDITPHLEGDFRFEGEVWMELEAVKAADRLTLHRGRGLGVDLDGALLELLEAAPAEAAPVEAAAARRRRAAAQEGDQEQDLEGASLEAMRRRQARRAAAEQEVQEAETEEEQEEERGVAEARAEREVEVQGAEERDGADRVSLLLGERLLPGRRYRLRLAFNGSLSDDLTGFYRVSFREGNATRWIAATVFEPAEARRAFPCMDEPALKARFQLNVGRREGLVALANTPRRRSRPKAGAPGWVWDAFAESPPMSTYLAAWAVGPLQSRAAEGGALRLWARASALGEAQFALDTGLRMQRLLAEWVGEPDPMPKTDLLALPSFVSDALENWGLISFAERYLLPPAGSAAAMSRVGFILGHELAHAWFGNLVTPAWWDAIWLNEGFATYFGALALDGARPELQARDTTAVRAFLEVFSQDALRSSQPLTAAAASSSDLYQIFGSMTYYKGYYVLRMLNHSLGADTFRRGVQRYVRAHRLGSVRQRDLWAALGEQARQDGVALPARGDVAALMAAWTRRAGYPLLHLRRDYAAGSVVVSQERFLRAPGDVEKSAGAAGAGGAAWWVPLTLTWEGGPAPAAATRPVAWLDPARANTTLNAVAPPAGAWLLANVEAAGLYRVNYDARNWRLLAEALRRDPHALPPLNRALLLDDALDLARAGRLPYATALTVLRYLRAERALAPWLAALGDLDYLHRMLPRATPVGAALQRFLLQLLGPRFAQLGLQPRAGEPAPDALARRLLARWACALGDAACVRASQERFALWRADPQRHPIPADLRPVVLCAAVEHGGGAEWDFLWQRFRGASSGSERAGVLAALGCSRDARTLARFLQLSIEKDSPIRKQQSASVFEAVAKNPVGHAVAKEFLKNNVDRIRSHVGTNPFHLSQLLQALAHRMNTVEELRELQRLQEEHEDSLRLATRTLRQAHEAVRFNVDWLARHREDIAAWLRTAPQAVAAPAPAPSSSAAPAPAAA